MLPSINPTTTKAWKRLNSLYQKTKSQHMRDAFKNQPQRVKAFSVFWEDFWFDYSKNRIDNEVMNALFDLADECELPAAIDEMFKGKSINATENRSVLHTALRNPRGSRLEIKGVDVMPPIHRVLDRMRNFSENVRNGTWKGYSGKRIKNIVNIGIGGSDLGPKMVVEALMPYQQENLNVFFVSNVDPSHIHEVLKELSVEETMFLIASKTFTTQETMLNAETAKKWFLDKALLTNHVKMHFVAMSTNQAGVEAFGIDPENRFEFWDFVGGRFSLWSAIGLPIMLSIGPDQFDRLLAGAHAMDVHFANEKRNNIPMIMGLLGIWYQNFYGADTHAVLPYDQYLHRFPAYLQQADMESNGKYVDRNGNPVDYQTGPIVFGEPGTNGQHAFYQLLHQGKKLIPADFIACVQSFNDYNDQHRVLYANFVAQTEALMRGKSKREVEADLHDLSSEKRDKLIPFKVFEGNRPTNAFVLKKLTPYNLGALIAAYEHKIFVQGVIWNIFSFDQWGVQLGKVLAKGVLDALNKSSAVPMNSDGSTLELIQRYYEWQEH